MLYCTFVYVFFRYATCKISDLLQLAFLETFISVCFFANYFSMVGLPISTCNYAQKGSMPMELRLGSL